MELREFAERVLFATSLEEKLACPGPIADENPGAALQTPAAPGRPAELRFKPSGTARGAFPGAGHIESPRDRGRLLHFFANHELLATELMALVLLRFPGAPAAFRTGVLRTLQDEQEHTRLYIQRMKECGIRFGEMPVSGYFWRSVAPMENPIDYVAGLCLTFEQANLDFARHYARGFAQAGDGLTAGLLERIYRDEIGHVAYGLKWFRRWKDPGQSDWDAFCRQLKFPLSPQRAKGFSLNVEGRRAAGLDERFIAELEVYSQSRGRTPNVYLFNPFAEARMAQGRAFTPRRHQAELARDLENLPQFLCRQDDIVLVQRRPGIEFLCRVKRAGFPLPEFVEVNLADSPPGATVGRHLPGGRPCEVLAGRKLGRLRPWAWGPDSIELLAPLFANLTAETRGADRSFTPRMADLYSKAWSAGFLHNILSDCASDSWLCAQDDVGTIATTTGEVSAALSSIRARGYSEAVLKRAHGLAGSNALRVLANESVDSHRAWISSALERGRVLVVEPWLDRVVDFSIQLEMTPGGLTLRGYTGLINDRKGQFRGNTAAPGFQKRIPAQVIEALVETTDRGDPPHGCGGQGARSMQTDQSMSQRVQMLYEGVFGALEAELRRAACIGPLGIDAFVYRGLDGRRRLKPVVEINPRYTMGRLTLELMRHAAPGAHGLFSVMNRSMVRGKGFRDFDEYARSLGERFPLKLEGEPLPRIREGAMCLNDPSRVRVCLAVFQVADHRLLP
jgi:uncharacterized ferritin-like protein (DUF455 family)